MSLSELLNKTSLKFTFGGEGFEAKGLTAVILGIALAVVLLWRL